MAEPRQRRNSTSQLLQELDVLSQNLYQSHTNRRAASLELPQSAIPTLDAVPTTAVADAALINDQRPRSRRMSMSPFHTRSKAHHEPDDAPVPATEEKKGIWGWRPMRALAHLRMQRLSCLFSVEVISIHRLPATMNGLRLSVAVRKTETKEGSVQTMPARVLQGSADFEETLFIRCHVYCSGKPPKFEPRPFLISAVAIDAPELDFGKSSVDLSLMVKESMDRNLEGTRVRQWDTVFELKGKAKGGELVVKLGFQIMADGGVEIYKQGEGTKSFKNPSSSSLNSASLLARRQSKSSFSVSSPKVTRSEPSMTPSKAPVSMDLRGIDEFSLDEPAAAAVPITVVQKPEEQKQQDDLDLDLPEFEVVDKGVELQGQEEQKQEAESEAESESESKSESASAVDEASVSSEVVKEVVHDSAHFTRLTELDAIAKQIKELESMVTGDEITNLSATKTEQENENHQRLDADEETVTREFLQMLELDGEEEKELALDMQEFTPASKSETEKCFLSDLGKGLGSVVRTRDGGYLAAMNPFDTGVSRKETPKLSMQISKPIFLKDQKIGSGVELFQKLAALGPDELTSTLAFLASMDELMNKTAEQIAFEGMASVIISGRNKEGASSSAAKSIAELKSMATAMTDGRKERILTGIWNVKEEPIIIDEIMPFSLQKIETMAIEALKIQAEMADEEPPFEVSPLVGTENPLANSASTIIDENVVTALVVIQMRDPLRRYETVGAPVISFLQAARVDDGSRDGESKFKVANLHLGGMKLRSGTRRSGWDGEKQRLTAMQWLVAYGLGKAGKKGKNVKGKGRQDSVWSVSSRVMADMWLKPMRNPDVKFPEKL